MWQVGLHQYHVLWPLKSSLWHSKNPKRGPFLAPNGPFGGPWRSQTVLGGHIWSQVPPICPTEWNSWLPHTLTWFWAFWWLPGAPKGPHLAQNATFRGVRGPFRRPSGPDLVATATATVAPRTSLRKIMKIRYQKPYQIAWWMHDRLLLGSLLKSWLICSNIPIHCSLWAQNSQPSSQNALIWKVLKVTLTKLPQDVNC